MVWISPRSLGVICYERWVLSQCHINYFKDWCLMNSELTFVFLTHFWIMVILSKGCNPYNFEPHNSLKLSFKNIGGLCSNFVECESFLESNSPDILALCETHLDDSSDSGNLSVRGYLFFNSKRCHYSYAWSCSLCERRTWLPFAQDLYLENSADSYLRFELALFYWVCYFFFLYQSSSSLCTVSASSISSNIDDSYADN